MTHESEFQSLTYADIDYADRYFAYDLHATAWQEAYEDVKAKALVTATRQIDTNNFIGVKAHHQQKLEFPRRKNTRPLTDVELIMYADRLKDLQNDIPEDIKKATCEQALMLIKEMTTDNTFDTLRAKGVKSYTVGDSSISFDNTTASYALSQITPKAITYLNPYIQRYTRLI